MEITQEESYRLLLRSGRNYNIKIKATKNIQVGRYSPKSQEKLEAELKGGQTCLKT